MDKNNESTKAAPVICLLCNNKFHPKTEMEEINGICQECYDDMAEASRASHATNLLKR